MTLRLGTRGSQLALVQANAVAALLRERASVDCHIVVIKTSGDRMSNESLADAGFSATMNSNVRMAASFCSAASNS